MRPESHRSGSLPMQEVATFGSVQGQLPHLSVVPLNIADEVLKVLKEPKRASEQRKEKRGVIPSCDMAIQYPGK